MTSASRSTPPPEGSERRSGPRLPAAAVPHLKAHVVGHAPVRLIDISKRGVRLESSSRLTGGGTLTIRFIAAGQVQWLTAAVVRDTVVVVETSGTVTYHTALAFTDELILCGDEFSMVDHSGTAAPQPTLADAEHDYSMLVYDGRIGAPKVAREDEAR